MRFLLILAVTVIAGCVTAEQRAAREAAYLASLEQRCEKLGFRSGSEPMAQCKLTLSQGDRSASIANAAAGAAVQANIREAMKLPSPAGVR